MTNPTGSIELSVSGNVASLVLHQPDRMNALTFDMWRSLPQQIARAEANPDVRVLTVAGAGEAAFCAGADISEFGEKRTDPQAVAVYNDAIREASAALRRTRLPTVAMIRGICYGGGLGLAMCCDLRYASTDARFRIPAGRLGLGYGFRDIALLTHRVGPGAVAEILYTAAVIDADRAKELRLVHKLFPGEDFLASVNQEVAAIASNAPLTLRAVKTALLAIEDPLVNRSVAEVDDAVKVCFDSADYREGQLAFREKRKPQFRGV